MYVISCMKADDAELYCIACFLHAYASSEWGFSLSCDNAAAAAASGSSEMYMRSSRMKKLSQAQRVPTAQLGKCILTYMHVHRVSAEEPIASISKSHKCHKKTVIVWDLWYLIYESHKSNKPHTSHKKTVLHISQISQNDSYSEWLVRCQLSLTNLTNLTSLTHLTKRQYSVRLVRFVGCQLNVTNVEQVSLTTRQL